MPNRPNIMIDRVYSIVVDDSEMIMLEAALEMMREKCSRELNKWRINRDYPIAPYWAYDQSAKSIMEKLSAAASPKKRIII